MRERIVRIEERDREFIVWVDDLCEAVFDRLDLAQAWVDGFQHGEMEDAD